MVPATLEGATVLDTAGLAALIEAEAPILVDVLPKQRPAPGRNADMPWMERGREHIPGSVWLPNTGYGELPPDFAEYFETELAKLTDGDPDHPLVFYCDANCWMSWNAAKRAMEELGYTNVYWYPEGVNGWQAAGLDLAEAGPVTMPEFTD
jgi:PQQ-dependent catabolism-associated CXXCW motif protein